MMSSFNVGDVLGFNAPTWAVLRRDGGETLVLAIWGVVLMLADEHGWKHEKKHLRNYARRGAPVTAHDAAAFAAALERAAAAIPTGARRPTPGAHSRTRQLGGRPRQDVRWIGRALRRAWLRHVARFAADGAFRVSG